MTWMFFLPGPRFQWLALFVGGRCSQEVSCEKWRGGFSITKTY